MIPLAGTLGAKPTAAGGRGAEIRSSESSVLPLVTAICRGREPLQHDERIAHIYERLAELTREIKPSTRTETVSDVARMYLDATKGRHAASTEANRVYRLGQFMALFGHRPMASILVADVEGFIRSFPERSHPNIYTTITPFLRWAAKKGWRGAAESIPEWRPKTKSRTRWLSDEEFAAALERIERYARTPRAREGTVDALRLAVRLSLRAGEIVSLRVRSVSPCGRYLYLEDTKVGDRVVPLADESADILIRRKNRSSSPEDFLFPAPSRTGHATVSGVSHAFRRVVALPLGITDVCLHSCRHSWASIALRKGKRLERVRRVLGHSTTHMTAKYSHLAQPELHRLVADVEAAIVSCGGMKENRPSPAEPVDPWKAARKMSAAQKALLRQRSELVVTSGPGQTQAALALVRARLLDKCDGGYRRTPGGLRVASALGELDET